MRTNTAPFGDCKKAPLHHTAHIQTTGALIAVNASTQLVVACSDNLHNIFGLHPEQVLGQSASQVFGASWARVSKLTCQPSRHQVGQIDSVKGQTLTLIGHRQEDQLFVELEPESTTLPNSWDHSARSQFIEQLNSTKSVAQCLQLLVNSVAQQAKLDRVMAYRFLPDWHGEVIAEACRPGIGGFLGLRFPASDVPANVRQLYTLNWHRMIADVDDPTSALQYWSSEDGPLDMSYSVLRAVHPVHIQYLRNMGVQASLSLSLVVNGRLWGLVACHNMATLTLNIHQRLALEEIAKLISLHLQNLLSLIEQQQHSELRERLSLVRGALQSSGENPRFGLAQNLNNMRELFQANGAWLHFEGEDFVSGLTPDAQALPPLRDWLDLLPKEKISHYHQLPNALGRHPAIVRHASGALHIPLSPSDFLIFLRQEVVHVVNWAGKPSPEDAEQPALTPRHSFATWSQELRQSAEPWQDSELKCAENLRQQLLDFISMAQLEQVALHDPLTGLANRLLFEKRLHQEVQHAFQRSGLFAVHMIDLDKFKPVNDSLGHAAGDALLKSVAQRLLQLVRSEDTVARLGGDEFAIIQAGLTNKEAACLMAARIVEDIARPYEIHEHKVEIGTSIGIALFPADSSDQDELLEKADQALYAVKKTGRNAFSLFTPALHANDERHLDEDALRAALHNKELTLYYQPIVDARTGGLRGLESFLRWNHPQEGLLSAERFMPLVERLHLGATIGEWVLQTTFKQYKDWLSQGLPSVPITINIGPSQFSSQDLMGQITSLAEHFDTGWEWLRLDIKEEAIIRDVNHASRKLRALRDGGVATQLDNYGCGFVSLGLMTQLPFIGIKFDAAALPLTSDPSMSMALLSIIKSTARMMNAKLTITRVERTEQIQWLRNQNIELVQGYALGEPICADEAKDLLRKLRL